MTDIRNASLVLKTSDFTARTDYLYGYPYTFQNGSINAKGSVMTWNNINLRTLLGDMYDKYNTFNICLNSISTSTANFIDNNAECKNVVIKLSGLPLINQSYNVTTLTNINKTVMGTFNFVQSNSTSQYYYSNNVATFGKNQDICNLTLEFSRVVDDSMPTTAFLTAISTYTATGAINQPTITLSANATSSIVSGSLITGAGIPANTYVYVVAGNIVVLSQNTNAALNATPITITPLASFPNSVFIFDIFGIKDDGDLPQRITY